MSAKKQKHNSFINIYELRFRYIAIGLVLVWSILLVRFFQVQVINHKKYAKMGISQSTSRTDVLPQRGSIYDRNGIPLAFNAGKNGNKRIYPEGNLAGQIIGFIGKDRYGLEGLEYSLDSILRGEIGWRQYRRDAKQRRLYEPGLPEKEAVDGRSLTLTIDVDLQEIAEQVLEHGVNRTVAKSGLLMVMEVATGDLLAVANYPFMNPSNKKDHTSLKLKNRSVNWMYEPGSTFKLITLVAALEEGVVDDNDIFKTNGGRLEIFGEVIKDSHNHGNITLEEAVKYSSNVAFSKIAMRIGKDVFYEYIKNFGFGSITGISFSSEENGILKNPSNWSGRSLATMAFGHEIAVTPLQILTAYGAVANRGVLMTPRIIKAIGSKNNWVQKTETPVRHVISKKVAEKASKYLKSVVSKGGTAELAMVDGITIAGKTGTSEKIDLEKGKYLRNKFVSSFVGFFPAKNPKLVCMVILDEPVRIHSGGKAAAPIFSSFLRRLICTSSLATKYKITLDDNKEIAKNKKKEEKIKIPSFVNSDINKLYRFCKEKRLLCSIDGKGVNIISQSPNFGAYIKQSGIIFVKTDNLIPDSVVVPNLKGLDIRDAIAQLSSLKIIPKIEGFGKIIKQSIKAGKKVPVSSICALNARQERIE